MYYPFEKKTSARSHLDHHTSQQHVSPEYACHAEGLIELSSRKECCYYYYCCCGSVSTNEPYRSSTSTACIAVERVSLRGRLDNITINNSPVQTGTGVVRVRSIRSRAVPVVVSFGLLCCCKWQVAFETAQQLLLLSPGVVTLGPLRLPNIRRWVV